MSFQDPTTISGNASYDIKKFLADRQTSFNTLIERDLKTTFAESVVKKIVISDISVVQNAIEPSRQEARAVCSIEVAEGMFCALSNSSMPTCFHSDMINGIGSLHGGCSSLLIDLCSTLAIVALQMHLSGSSTPTVSQSMNVFFHAPAVLWAVLHPWQISTDSVMIRGEVLQIINTSISIGKRVVSAKTEVRYLYPRVFLGVLTQT